jgi:RimJ/RimL family protein N-acetyltransferase
MQLETKRLLIRPWQKEDHEPFAGFNADAAVRQFYYPALLTRAQSDEIIEQCMQHLSEHGFGFLALERKSDRELVGGAGLSWTNDVPGGPRVELGWILGEPYWRQGFASEASIAWFDHAWSIGLDEIVGYTSAINTPSRALMTSLGMIHNPADDFADPTVPTDNVLSPHVLFTIERPKCELT